MFPSSQGRLLASLACLLLVCGGVFAQEAVDDDPPQSPQPTQRELLRREAEALRPLVSTLAADQFLAAVDDLPAVQDRVVHYDRVKREAISVQRWEQLDEAEREAYERMELGERFYYTTRYGTPLAYVRSLELTARAGLKRVDGRRIFDFGYGTIGHLRLLASLGAHVVGVEVDSLLRELYAVEGDTGSIERAQAVEIGEPGSITLHHGFFPADAELTDAIGGGYDVFISKNTLKRGYIHPEREVDPRMLVHLGVDDETYVRAVHRMLNAGGLMMIYNLYPAPAAEDQPYKPWADGRSPFDRELFEAVGFEIIAYNEDDTEAARAMAAALGWDASMNLETDLFAMYTLVRKR